MSMMSEFKDFAMRGNVVDMAVGIVVGTAFGKITKSLVADVLMPPIGLLIGGIDFSNIVIPLRAATEEAEAVAINVGLFLNTVIEFVIIAFAIFMVIRLMNSMKKKEAESPAAPPAPSTEQVLLTEIRDALRQR